jgi:uncharacterized protein
VRTRLHRLLNRTQKVHLRQLVEEVERETGVEIAVLLTSHVDDIESFATAYFNHTGIGKREHDNGVLILVVVERRLVRIEVGRGLASVVPPEAAQRIIDDVMTPQFRRRRFGYGLLLGVEAIGRLVRGGQMSAYTHGDREA